jgi:hypothetical protein
MINLKLETKARWCVTLVSLILLLGLAACSSTGKPVETAQTIELTETAEHGASSYPDLSSVQPTQADGIYPDPPQTTQAPPPTQSSDAYPAIATQVVAPGTDVVPTLQATKKVDSELHATDPASFQLASGKIQLVEFFAFW